MLNTEQPVVVEQTFNSSLKAVWDAITKLDEMKLWYFELIEVDGEVNLKLSMKVVESFQEDIPEFRRDSCIGGWNYFIKQRLKQYLEPNKKQT